ncbi:MAG: dihydrodipicolinate reductase [Cypionkella sp.]|nr:dihydrodipicolinate reductase [Cypionkella sp.]
MFRWIAVFTLWATPSLADFRQIVDERTFLNTLDGRALNIGLFNLAINVLPSGQITGTAVGWDLTGNWEWKDGLFCREIDWSGMAIEYNCQLVETDGAQMRFTSDAGNGRSADFRLR